VCQVDSGGLCGSVSSGLMWLMWECVKCTDVAFVGVCQVD